MIPETDRFGNVKLSFKKWTTPEGMKVLTQVVKTQSGLEQLNISDWESNLIYDAYWELKRFKKLARLRKVARKVSELANELEIFRRAEPPAKDLIKRLKDLPNSNFKGKREHLVRLYASVRPEDNNNAWFWNRWRKETNVKPDLRGADLSGLILTFLNMKDCDLRNTNLSAATARVTDFRYSDFRGAEFSYTDFSHSNLAFTKMTRAVLYFTMLNGCWMEEADLRYSKLIGTAFNHAHLPGANLNGSVIWGINTWNLHVSSTTKQNGYVFPGFLAEEIGSYEEKDFLELIKSNRLIQVRSLRVAHFLSLLHDNHNEIGDVINASVDKIVLLLGRFAGKEKKVLDRLKEELPGHGYIPIVFNFKEPENRDLIETVSVLAGLSHFVIANLSKPRSTPLESHLVIPNIAVPFVPIIRKGEDPFSMFSALQRKYPWVLDTVYYTSEESLMRKLKKDILRPATKMAREIKKKKHPGRNQRTTNKKKRKRISQQSKRTLNLKLETKSSNLIM